MWVNIYNICTAQSTLAKPLCTQLPTFKASLWSAPNTIRICYVPQLISLTQMSLFGIMGYDFIITLPAVVKAGITVPPLFLPFNSIFSLVKKWINVSSPLRDWKVISLFPPYLLKEQINFPCNPPCSLSFFFSPNRCLTVCVASWVINPGFHSTKFGCSRFLSALSWDLSACTQHWGASFYDTCQPQEMIWYEYEGCGA